MTDSSAPLPVVEAADRRPAATLRRSITSRYVLALGIVALLSLVAFTALQLTIKSSERWAAVVNISGRQRMLSQRTTLFAQRAIVAQGSERAQILTMLQADMALMRQSHEALLSGEVGTDVHVAPSEAVLALYRREPIALDAMVRRHLSAVQAIVTDLQAGVPMPSERLQELINQATGPLLQGLDAVVQQYQQEAEADIRRLSRVETLVLVLTALVLCLEAVLIFRPMVTRIVNERQRIEDAGRFLRTIFDNSHDAILTVVDGVVESANTASGRIWEGQRPAQLVGRQWNELFLPSEGGEVDHDNPDPIAQGFKTLVTRGNGGRKTVDAAFSSTAVGNQVRYVVCLRESTAQLIRYAARLRERNRELDRFASIASHDLRAPLRAIVNLTSWLQEDLAEALDVGSRDHMDLLVNRVRRMDALVDGLHQYATAGRRSEQIEAVDLEALIREVVDDRRGEQVVDLRLEGVFPTIHTEATRLWQVLSNLVGNAVRHHDGHLVCLAITGDIQGDRVHLAVRDDGPGIHPDHHRSIFEIFKTVKGKDDGGGLGLGLALVQKIVREHGGEVALESAPGAGTTISFDWPMDERAA